ncbi:MAG: hypothetical protein V1773_09555 [bacterium]
MRKKKNYFIGDEERYINFAKNLLHGFYSPAAPYINLWNGPGYPIVILPFIAFNIPYIFIALLNVLFYYFSVVILFITLKKLVSAKTALIFGLFWALYYNSYQDMPLIITETFSAFLIVCIAYFVVTALQDKRQNLRNCIFAGICFGYLVLTKIIFGYVLLFLLTASFILFIFKYHDVIYRKIILIMIVAFITILSYLIYTFNLTGKVFYFGNSGGLSLYCMSSLNENEYGSFFDPELLYKDETTISGINDSLKAHHNEDYKEIYKYTGVERDEAFKRYAINNIKKNPIKYAKNCLNNIGRLLFNYPFSYTIQSYKTLLRIPANALIVFLMIFAGFLSLINWRQLALPIVFLLSLAFLYLGASILVSAYNRMFTVVVPILLIWIAYTLDKTVKINIKFENK